MTRRIDYVLVLVLNCVEFSDNVVMTVVEGDERNDFTRCRFEA